MSTRRNRFLWRSFRAFIYATVFTILVATALFFLVGPSYDATTVFSPTDQAMRQVVDAGNEAAQRPTLTNDVRREEAMRIAYGASSRQNVGKALYHLANAPVLRQELRISEIDTTDGVNYDVVKKAVEDRIKELKPGIDIRTWRPTEEITKDKKGDQDREGNARIVEIQSRSSIPLGLWTEFVYLDLTLDHHNLSRDLLRPDNLPKTVARLNVSPELASPRDIMLNVRYRDPRMTEVLANAITATYKHQYDSGIMDGSLKQLRFYHQRQLEAAQQYAMARDSFAKWLRVNSHRLSAPKAEMNKVPSNPKELQIQLYQRSLEREAQSYQRVLELEAQSYQRAFDASGEALSEASRALRRTEEAFRMAEESGGLTVMNWAGMPPGTRDHPESPARLGGTKLVTARLTFLFLLGFVGNLGLSYALGALKRGISEARSETDDVAEEELSAAQREGENNF